MVTMTTSEYLLVCEAFPGPTGQDGRWHFRLESSDGQQLLEADDEDLGDSLRLSLLAVVRGMEALEAPSQITLIVANRYVLQGMRTGLAHWRDTDFRWEHFGRMLPVANADLWRRIDRALGIHEVQACWMSSACLRLGKALANQPVPTPMGAARWLTKQAMQPAAA